MSREKMVACPKCGGSGRLFNKHNEPFECYICGGKGVVIKKSRGQ